MTSDLVRGTRDYACKGCGMKFEYFHLPRGEDTDQIPECPKCNSKEAERLITAPAGHILKGTGWYKDGY